MGRSPSDEGMEYSDTASSHGSVSEPSSRDASGSIAPNLSSLTDTASSVQRTAADNTAGPQSNGPDTRGQYAQRYGVDIDMPSQVDRLQRLEASNSLETVQRWAGEGIPIEAMGTPSKMEAYRSREDTPIPWDAEQRNTQSVQRSTRAAADTSPAGETQVPESVRAVVSSPGEPVDPALRKPVESEIGQSLEHARVHRSPAADAACDQLNARAFTVKNHVAVRSDQPDPQTPAGQHLMSHELTHVAQQTGGAVSLLPDTGALEVDPDPQLEREAEETAQRVMSGGEVGIQRMSDSDVHIQRMPPTTAGDRSSQVPNTSLGATPTVSTVPPSRPSGLLSKAEFETRGARLRGEARRPDGRKIPGAMKQRGEGCWLAVLQAAWAAVGADTTALTKILSFFSSRSSVGELVTSPDVQFTTALGGAKQIHNNIKSHVMDIVYTNIQSSPESRGMTENLMRYSDVKAPAFAFAYLWQIHLAQQKSNNPDARKLPQVTAEDVRVARNLLTLVCRHPKQFLFDSPLAFGPDESMENQKQFFMKIVNDLGTPLMLGLETQYTRTGFGPRADTDPEYHRQLIARSVPRGTSIDVIGGPHATLVAGVTEENGTIYVMYRDPYQDDNTYDIQTLDEFLTPRLKSAIETMLQRPPNSSDVMTLKSLQTSDAARRSVTNQ